MPAMSRLVSISGVTVFPTAILLDIYSYERAGENYNTGIALYDVSRAAYREASYISYSRQAFVQLNSYNTTSVTVVWLLLE